MALEKPLNFVPGYHCAAEKEAEDGCSICFELFTPQNPANILRVFQFCYLFFWEPECEVLASNLSLSRKETCQLRKITNCKHEFHLQCILEWSQRSTECPICCKPVVLMDPDSQELLTAVQNERSSRLQKTPTDTCLTPNLSRNFGDEHEFSLSRHMSLNRSITQNNVTAGNLASPFRERKRQSYYAIGSPGVFVSGPSADMPVINYTYDAAREHDEILSDGVPGNSSSIVRTPTSISRSHWSPNASSFVVGSDPGGAASRIGPFKVRKFSGVLKIEAPAGNNQSPQNPCMPDILSLPESLKTKFSAACARYKDSFSKGTKGLKEKIFSQNKIFKGLRKGIQCELQAGLAGVTRLIENLHLSSKQTRNYDSASSCAGTKANFSIKGKAVQGNISAQSVGASLEN